MLAGLTPSQVEELRGQAFRLLEEPGFRVQHEGLLGRLGRAGATVDGASGRVRLPSSLLRELLAQAPPRYQVGGLSGRQWCVGGQERHCLAIVTDPWIIDSGSGHPRRPRLTDVQRHTRLAQQLEEVAAISLMDYPVADVSGPFSNLRALEAYLLEHDKHLHVMPTSAASFGRWERLLEVLATNGAPPGVPLVTLGVAVLSPLTLTPDNGELLLAACRGGFPVVPTVCPMAGTTAPYTLGGTLLQAHAEALLVAALVQLVRPGHPVLHVIGPSRTDMRTGEDLYYTLDKVLWKIAGVQLGQACGLPTGAECGGTMASRYDLQSGAEGVLFMLAAWHSGAHLLAGIGSCGNAVTMSAEMMLVQTAWLRAARFLSGGLPGPTAGDLASLCRVGPGGHFLEDPLTLEELRAHGFFEDPLLDCVGGHLGHTPMLQRAQERAAELLAAHRSPLPGRLQEGIRAFFRQECGGPSGG
ncbi:MAG: trimethylamine methyltransferase family protein [Candidatus Latescibacterota bacterium]